MGEFRQHCKRNIRNTRQKILRNANRINPSLEPVRTTSSLTLTMASTLLGCPGKRSSKNGIQLKQWTSQCKSRTYVAKPAVLKYVKDALLRTTHHFLRILHRMPTIIHTNTMAVWQCNTPSLCIRIVVRLPYCPTWPSEQEHRERNQTSFGKCGHDTAILHQQKCTSSFPLPRISKTERYPSPLQKAWRFNRQHRR